MKRFAQAVWQGDLERGEGKLNSTSRVLADTPYSYKTRFGSQLGTNPEELIAAAHAGCFAMALSGELQKKGFKADLIEVGATVTLDQVEGSWAITESQLELSAEVPGIDEAQLRAIAEAAKAGCPVSKLLKAKIGLVFKSLKVGKAA